MAVHCIDLVVFPLPSRSNLLPHVSTSRAILPRNMALSHTAARLWATCPDDRFRAGPRALKLAKALFGKQPSLEHGEAVAMALAETGNFEYAKKVAREGHRGANGTESRRRHTAT